jgi:hypothetical protein
MHLVEFMRYWREIRSLIGLDYGRGAVRYTRADWVRGFLESRDLPLVDFAATLYAYDLFDQTLHTYVFMKEENFSHFVTPELPGVTGLFSTSGKRVCPALLPTMLLYCPSVDPSLNDGDPDRCIRIAQAEMGVWMGNIDAFKARVDAVGADTRFLIGVPDPALSDERAINLLQEKYAFEHQQLDAQIRSGESKGRVLNF